MKKWYYLIVLFSITLVSCENTERLDEIKQELNSSKKTQKNDEESTNKVSLSAPSLNLPPAKEEAEDEGMDFSDGEYYEGGDEYSGEDYYESDYESDYGYDGE
ncbi:MAG: hypothetical protein RIT43_1042 [Bacteroidota bacterium]|jgi:hypothetical protein